MSEGADLPSNRTVTPSLFHGIESLVSTYFEGQRLQHRTLLLAHRKSPPSIATGQKLTLDIFSKIQANFRDVLASQGIRHSRENWRLHSPGVDCDDINKPREVGLERALVSACHQQNRRDWWNQVPIASGLLGPHAGKKRAIDLVHQRGEAAFDFVELKIDSDTPLYALVEILQYGFVWLLTRKAKDQLGYTSPTLLDADDVRLSVLAPAAFYGQVDYSELSKGVNEALQEIVQKRGVSMSLSFKKFPDNFKWNGARDGGVLCPLLDGLYPD